MTSLRARKGRGMKKLQSIFVLLLLTLTIFSSFNFLSTASANPPLSGNFSNVYVANSGSNTVSIIGLANSTNWKTVTVGADPYGVAISSSNVYVANYGAGTVSIIGLTNNTNWKTVTVSAYPYGVAISSSFPSQSSSFSSQVPSYLVSFKVYWSGQYPSTTTYNANVYTTSPIIGVIGVYSISFSSLLSSATYVLSVFSYTITYNETFVYHVPTPTTYTYSQQTYSYLISQNVQYFNSSNIFFNFTIPSSALTSYSASYSVQISNLTLTNPSAPVDQLSLNSQNFTYYVLSKYKSTYNITAYKNYSTAQNANIKFSTSETVNYYPTVSYDKMEYAGAGSTLKLLANVTTIGGGYTFSSESLQITNINWGDGSPIQSSPVQVPTNSYYNFSISHQYAQTGTYTITFLAVNAVGKPYSLSTSGNASISITISVSTTSAALPLKTNQHIFFNYTQVNVNIQEVKLYINNILAQSNNTTSNTNYAGTVSYDVPYYITQTATFTAEWTYSSGSISGNVIVQYSISNSVPTVGRWVILNYTLGTGTTSTKESVPYFYSQKIQYNVSWSYFVWQILLPSNAWNISVKGSVLWQSPVISVPADFYPSNATFKLLENFTEFQVTWLGQNPVGNALVVIEYYPQSAVFGEFGVNIPFNQFNTFFNGKQIYSPTQQVDIGQSLIINTTSAYGKLISSYSITVSEQTQFVEIPLDIVPLTVMNMNSSYVVGMQVSQGSISQNSQFLTPLSSNTFYVPAGTYNFSFGYYDFNSYAVSHYYNTSITLSGVSYFVINGITLSQLDATVKQSADNITNLIENVNITFLNSNDKIKNLIVSLSLNMNNTNSTIYSETIKIFDSLTNVNSTVVNEANSVLSSLKNDNSTLYNQTLKIYSTIVNSNSTIYSQTLQILTKLKNDNSTLYNQTLKILTDVNNVNTTLYNQIINVLTKVENTNTTLYNQLVSVLTNVKNYNSSIFNQTLSILTSIKNMNTTLYSQMVDILTNVRNDNSTLYNQTLATLTYIRNLNSSIGAQLIYDMQLVQDLNSSIVFQYEGLLRNVSTLANESQLQYLQLEGYLAEATGNLSTLSYQLVPQNGTLSDGYYYLPVVILNWQDRVLNTNNTISVLKNLTVRFLSASTTQPIAFTVQSVGQHGFTLRLSIPTSFLTLVNTRSGVLLLSSSSAGKNAAGVVSSLPYHLHVNPLIEYGMQFQAFLVTPLGLIAFTTLLAVITMAIDAALARRRQGGLMK